MGKPLGLTKSGGRKKGTPNKNTTVLAEALDLHGIDVVGKLTELLPQLTIEKQADILVSLMSYLYPKRKAIEVSTDKAESDKHIQITFVKPKSA